MILSIGRKTVRNFVAHQGSIQELTGSNFGIYWLADGKVLRFDQDIYELPLVETVRTIVWTTAYLVSKTSALFLGWDRKGPLPGRPLAHHWTATRDVFEPTWESHFLPWRDYLSTKADDPEFTVSRATESGVTLEQVRLRPDVFALAVPV
jgi:hypothetical protein